MNAHSPAGSARVERAWLPLFVLLFSLLVTALATLYGGRTAAARDRLRFQNAVERTRYSIDRHLETAISLLRGGAGFFAAGDPVDRASFRAYVERLQLRERYPGIQGIGFSRRLRLGERPALVQRMQREGAAGFRVWPEHPRAEYHAILYLEPLDPRNRVAIGYDMFSDPVRRAAMARARDTGLPAASGKVELVQEIDARKQAGFLIYVPVYRGGKVPATVTERRRRLEGFVYSPFRADDLLAGILGAESRPRVGFQIFDGETPGAARLLYRSGEAGAGGRPRFSTTQPLMVAGRPWSIRFATQPEFERTSVSGMVPVTLLAGLMVSLLLSGITWLQARGRAAAERSAAELRESEARVRSVFEANVLGILLEDFQGNIREANDAFLNLVGYSRAELQAGRLNGKELTPPEYHPRVEQALAELRERGTHAPFEKEYVRKDGTRVPVLVGNGLLPAAPEPLRVSFILDLKELKQAQAAVRYGEEQLRRITDAVPALISWVDSSGCYRFTNRAYEEWFGHSREEVYGKHVREVLGEDAYDVLRPYLEAALAGQEVSYEARVPYREGGTRFVSATYTPFQNREGQVEGFVVLVNDISQRHQMQEALREREQRLQEEVATVATINRIGQTLVSELDQQRLVQSLTDAATELVGAEFGAFFYNVVNEKGETYALYTISGAAREAFEQFPMPRNTGVFGPTFRGEGIVRADDITQDPRYGQNAPYHGMPEGHLPVRSYLAAPVASRSGEVLGGLFFGHAEAGVFTERDEQLLAGVAAQAATALDNAHLYRRAEQARVEAETASRLKDEFLATVSHELRTPLNAIMGYAQLLRRAPRTPEQMEKGLETIERNVKVQAQLINDLLDVSRIISGKLRLDVQPVDLAAVIQAAIDSVLPAAEAKGIRIERILDPLAAKMNGDPNRLQQVVWNLLSNAIRFTPNGGRVQVLLERVNSHLEITVSDTGQGIDPEFLPHVFDRFRQVDSSTTRRHGGLGLGLAIVRHLVELHGGTVRAKSTGEGQGATFIVTLPLPIVHDGWGAPGRVHPLAEPPHRPAEADGPLECPPSLKGLRVLVVDDEPDARELMQQILAECEAEVVAVGSARAAIEATERFRPDVLVSDIGMPGEDGYELIRQVRALPAERGGMVPAAALTAFARAEDRRRALLAGFQAHLPKPVERDDLITVVASLGGRTGE